MPFVAKKVSTGRRVDITKISKPRELKKEDFVCQLCDQPMIVKAGMSPRRAHFAHKVKCSSDYQSHPESVEHRFAKRFVAEGLKGTDEYRGATIHYEVPIPEVMRVADVLAVFLKQGWRIAHEIQLSSITIEELGKRTSDYESAGIDVVWYLGKAADTETNRDWCVRNIGVCYRVSFTAKNESSKLEG